MVSLEPELALLRTSTLLSEYIRKHLDIINTPVQLKVSPSVKKETADWTPEETVAGRRLVKLVVTRESYAKFHVEAQSVSQSAYTAGSGTPVISCIHWEEKNQYVVTSVDVITVLEHLVGKLFSIEEKSRIRRNLQFLKPATITRSNADSKRMFNKIMAMESPRPRNIEKDIKVFDWSELFVAVQKVLSKYSANPEQANSGATQASQSAAVLAIPSNRRPLRSDISSKYPSQARPAEHLNYTSGTRCTPVGFQLPVFPTSLNTFLELPQHFSAAKSGRAQVQAWANSASAWLRRGPSQNARHPQQQTIQV